MPTILLASGDMKISSDNLLKAFYDKININEEINENVIYEFPEEYYKRMNERNMEDIFYKKIIEDINHNMNISILSYSSVIFNTVRLVAIAKKIDIPVLYFHEDHISEALIYNFGYGGISNKLDNEELEELEFDGLFDEVDTFLDKVLFPNDIIGG